MPKRKLSIILILELFEWMEGKIENEEYSNYSHAVEYVMRKLSEIKKRLVFRRLDQKRFK